MTQYNANASVEGSPTAREAQLEALLSAGAAAQALFALDGRLLLANKAFAAAFGHLPDEIEGARLARAGASPAVVEHVEAQIRRVAATGSAATVEELLPGLSLTLAPVRNGDGIIGSVAAVADSLAAHEALRLELQAAKAEVERTKAEAARARAAAGKFLSTANHDLRQPFQAMQLFHHLLMNKLTDPAARDLGEKLEMAIMSSDTLLRVLVEVSRLEAGLVESSQESFALDDSLERLSREFAGEAEAKSLRFTVRPAGAEVHSDPILLERLLRPLFSNALRYTETGGVLVGTRRRGDRLLLEVWDSGIGIAEKDIEAAFEDFRQLGNPNRDRKQGLGLGLSITRRLAALLGHPMTLRSRPGRGTVVTIELPLAEGPRTEAEIQAVRSAAEEKATQPA